MQDNSKPSINQYLMASKKFITLVVGISSFVSVINLILSGFLVQNVFHQQNQQAQAQEFRRKLQADELLNYELPVKISPEKVKPCDQIDIKFIRSSKITTKVTSIYQLNKLLPENQIKKISQPVSTGMVEESFRKEITFNYKVSCEFEPGTYYFDGLVSYEVEGVPKDFVWYSDKFTVESSRKESSQ